MSKVEEWTWISQVVMANDQRGFARLMERYQPSVRRYFLLQTNGDEAVADDLTQETFIRAWQGLSSFRRLSSFSTWLYRIAFNAYCNYWTRRKEELRLDDPQAVAVLGKLSTQEAPSIDPRLPRLQKAMEQLSPAEKTCLTLFYLEELSVNDIHQVTGYGKSTIRSYLTRGRNHLQTLINQTV